MKHVIILLFCASLVFAQVPTGLTLTSELTSTTMYDTLVLTVGTPKVCWVTVLYDSGSVPLEVSFNGAISAGTVVTLKNAGESYGSPSYGEKIQKLYRRGIGGNVKSRIIIKY